MLDRYELIAELATGGMARVYLARLGGLAGFQRLFAIKHLHPYLHGDQQFVQMFLDEARLAAGIHHPHVVSILEVGAGDDGYYLVMEYVEGDTLARLLARASSAGHVTIPIGISVRIFLHVLEGLEAAHNLTDGQGRPLEIVHRDVSPQNILVGVDGITRLTDFGVARAATRLNATRAGQLKGKLAYMAPEQARSELVDRRTDVFAAGVVLWEALSMRRLFRGNSDVETLNRVLFEPIPRVREVNPAVPPALDDVVAKALQRLSHERFPSCAAFADAIESAVPVIASPRDVSVFVQSTLGHEIEAQREQVRTWLARSEPSQAWPVVGAVQPPTGLHGPPPLVSPHAGSPISVDPALIPTPHPAPHPPPPQRSPGVYVALGAGALGVIVSIAGLGWWVTRSEPAPAPTPARSVASPPAPLPEPIEPDSSALVPVSPSGTAEVSRDDAGAATVHPPQRPPPTTRKLPTEKDDMATNPYR